MSAQVFFEGPLSIRCSTIDLSDGSRYLCIPIDREELIAAGSPEEIEIRACALHAVELMKSSLHTITAMGLDYVLWNRGQEKHYKTIKPRHRARSVYY